MLCLLSQLLEELDLHLVHLVLDSSHHLVEQLDCTVQEPVVQLLVHQLILIFTLEALVLEVLLLEVLAHGVPEQEELAVLEDSRSMESSSLLEDLTA